MGRAPFVSLVVSVARVVLDLRTEERRRKIEIVSVAFVIFACCRVSASNRGVGFL